jgi:hypothetical protein
MDQRGRVRRRYDWSVGLAISGLDSGGRNPGFPKGSGRSFSRLPGEPAMPFETIVVVSAIVSVFVAFAALLTLADMTSGHH